MYFITLAIPVLSGTFWEMSSVRDSLTMECMVSFSDNNRDLKQQRQLGLQLGKCHLKDVFHTSNFIGLIPSRSIHQMLPVFSGVICCERLYQSSRKEKQCRCLVFTFSTKCEIRHFQVVVM